MKLSLVFAVLFSFSAFANVDQFIGSYKVKRGAGVATITKVLVAERTLFDPDKYEYQILAQDVGPESAYVEGTLEVSEDGKSLSLSTDNECDDPGCRYFTDISVEVTKKGNNKPQIKINYEGFQYGEGSDDESREFSGTATLYKK